MSLPLSLHPLPLQPKPLSLNLRLPKPKISKTQKLSRIKSKAKSQDQHIEPSSVKPRWENWLSAAASLYPLYVTVGGVVACIKPSAFSWFVEKGPLSYSFSLGFIMLAMGLTVELKDLLELFRQRPLSIIFGCAAQYTIMPAFGAIVSRAVGLPPSLSVGLILLACCPGGTASNVSKQILETITVVLEVVRCHSGDTSRRPFYFVALSVHGLSGIHYLINPCTVTLIAQGDVALSIVVTVCTTLAAVVLTPLLTKILAGAIVPVDAVKLSLSTLQVVVAPILLGSYMQNTFPSSVKVITPFAPLLAVLTSSLLASSVFSENVVRLKSSIINSSHGSELGSSLGIRDIFSGDLRAAILSVLLLHFAGFFVGYLSAAICGFKERQRRAISIEVGMQNSSLGVVLATAHFSSPLVALAPALSAVIMNIMGSTLGFIWRYVHPSDIKDALKTNVD